jgi:hypothetical protein
MPKSRPVRRVRPRANQATLASMVMAGKGRVPGGRTRLRMRIAAMAARRPKMPPPAQSATLSMRSWRTRRWRVAPMAVRMAISLWRAAARASRRLAMLAQAMRRTKRTAHMRMRRPVRRLDAIKVSGMETRRMPQS